MEIKPTFTITAILSEPVNIGKNFSSIILGLEKRDKEADDLIIGDEISFDRDGPIRLNLRDFNQSANIYVFYLKTNDSDLEVPIKYLDKQIIWSKI